MALTIGQASQTVTVTTQTPLIDTATSSNAAVIAQRQVTEQPLNGRDFESLLTTLPGMVTNNNSQFRLVFNQTDDFYVNGMRGTANNFFLDGIINTDVGANDGEYTDLSLDAVGEFKTLTGNFNAEYGRSPGVMILVNTKSGGQHFHGTAYEFNRNTDFNANDWFSNHQRFGQGGSEVQSVRRQYRRLYSHPKDLAAEATRKHFSSSTMKGRAPTAPTAIQAGPAAPSTPCRNRRCLALALPMDRLISRPSIAQATCAISTAPATCTPIHDTNGNLVRNGQVFMPGTIKYNSVGEVLTGTPYPGNIIPASQFSSQYAAMIKYFTPGYRGSFTHPTYNNGFGDEQQINFQDTYTFTKNQYVARVDYNFGPKANAFFRYVDDRQQESQGFGIFSGNSFPVLPQYRKKPGKSYGWSLVNVISPTLTNEATVGWLHLTQVVDIVPGTSKSLYDKGTLGFNFSDHLSRRPILTIWPRISIPATATSTSARFLPVGPRPATQSSRRMT